MAKLYYDKDADLSLIQSKKVAILGYGSQGHAHALNLRDSGCNVCVGLPETSASRSKAEKDGLTVKSPSDAAAWADVIMVLVPDTKQQKLYNDCIAPSLKPGKTLMFAHGFNIRFGTINPPTTIDVSMVAPKAPGHRVREVFTEGGGTPGLLAIEQDAGGKAKSLALSYARGIGCTRAGVLETTFTEETETVVDLIYRGGLSYMRYSISDTAEHGDYTAGPRIVTDDTRKAMKQLLAEIKDGSFAKKWIAENDNGCVNFLAKRKAEQQNAIEQLGPGLRAMMPFLQPIVAPGLTAKTATSDK